MASSIKDEYIYFPRTNKEQNFVSGKCAEMGLPGCVGSVDCVHIGWDKCPVQQTSLYKGKEGYPSVAYQVVCTSRKFIQAVSFGHPGARNDKHIACTDPAITDLLIRDGWLGRKSWSVIDNANGDQKLFFESYLLCDSGYHHWPCLVFPVKSGLPGSPSMNWTGMIESVQKNIEGDFGIRKIRFAFLKNFNRMHDQRNIDNAFITCCMLHNMLLKANG